MDARGATGRSRKKREAQADPTFFNSPPEPKSSGERDREGKSQGSALVDPVEPTEAERPPPEPTGAGGDIGPFSLPAFPAQESDAEI
jgi:hypothetical protein